jgi:hypothetical protein
MLEAEFGAKAAEFAALAAELAAFVSADTSATLAVEVLPEILAGVRQADLLTCRLIERADRSGTYAIDGAASTQRTSARSRVSPTPGCPSGYRSAGRWRIGCRSPPKPSKPEIWVWIMPM